MAADGVAGEGVPLDARDRAGAPTPHLVARVTARRAVRSGAVWGGVFGLYVLASASGYASTYPTVASRLRFSRSLEGNAGLSALIGPARHLETVAGFTSWRTMGVLSVAGAIWAMLLATRVLRGEEDAGRWEVLLSGHTTRRGATLQAMAGLAAGVAVLWAETAVIAIAVGSAGNVRFSVSASLFFATCLVTGAAMFMTVGALTSQLAVGRRQANGFAAAFLGVSFVIRMVADSGSHLVWLQWCSPLGWPEELKPLIGSRPAALVPIALLVATLSVATALLAARRDLGATAFPIQDSAAPRVGLLGSPIGLAVRLTRSVATGWILGLAAGGLVLGLVAQSAANAITGSASIEKALARLGGHRLGAAAYLGISLITAAVMVAFAAAGQVAATRGEEAEGYLDHVLARPVGRVRWLAGRAAVAAAIVVAGSLVTGLAAWAGAATQDSGLGFAELVKAGLNIAPPALFILGVGVLLYGVRPRIASACTYALVAWSFLIELVASLITTNRLLLDSSVFSHITPAPAASPDWRAAGALTALGLLGVAIGIAGFRRRDLAGA